MITIKNRPCDQHWQAEPVARCPQNECHLRVPRANTNSGAETGRASLPRTAGGGCDTAGKGPEEQGRTRGFFTWKECYFLPSGGDCVSAAFPSEGEDMGNYWRPSTGGKKQGQEAARPTRASVCEPMSPVAVCPACTLVGGSKCEPSACSRKAHPRHSIQSPLPVKSENTPLPLNGKILEGRGFSLSLNPYVPVLAPGWQLLLSGC